MQQPPLPERKRGSGVRLVYDVLRDEILDLKLPPGSAVDEVALADRFAMSRTPIREALVKLEGEGLITTLPNRSSVVSPIDFGNLNAFFDALTLMYRVSTRLAAEFHELSMIARNREFHIAVAEAGRNPYYLQLFGRLLDEGRRILRLYYYPTFQPQAPHPYVTEHQAMIAAIAARDMGLADTLARAHADQIVAQIRAMIARDQRQDVVL